MTRAAVAPLVVPAHLHESQRKASDPAASIWVSANAGSGKTHVLTQRVIRLLLGGIAPSKILCLTFTKAAAAQMATRVFAELSRWTRLDDGELHAAVVATGAPAPDAARLLLARRLFTRTVETPGGLKIQTIHAFCERLLHLFPFEANVPARFEVADERRTEEMLSLAKRATIAVMRGSEELTLVADVAGSMGVHRIIADAMKLRAEARRAASDVQAELAAKLGCSDVGSPEEIQSAMLNGLASRWSDIAEALAQGSASDQTQADRLRRTGAALAGRAADLDETLENYLLVFYTKDGAPRGRLVTNAVAKRHPDVLRALEAERDRLDTLRKRLKAAETVVRTNALVAIADKVMDRYHDAKSAQGLLDFDDLIERTLALLQHSDSGWVLHKLDAGIDHVLVDEAQDTSEAQWKILEHLTGDFAAGHTARGQDRSFFVVGDDKQSIFSFQGAAPLMFDEMRSRFEHRFKAGRKAFDRVELKTSFRSTPGILAAVDQVFDSALHQDGLVSGKDSWPTHDSIKSRLPALVEIWPSFGAEPAADPQDWSIPLDQPAEHDPVNQVADRVARKIRSLTAKDSPDRVHEGRGETPRPITPGDILVLVRTRGAFFEAVIRALKHHHVDVAGADRLDVANHIAVLDLVAAGRTALLPADDLSLACLLKSPLFGLTDDDLIALAPNRRGPLFSALAASPQPAHQAAHATITRWSAKARAATPFAFYVELLGRDGGRRLMEARLGPEAHDAIEEFLRLALAHEQQGPPSLGTFIADVEALESSIRRDMEAPGDSVRVMTVHAAKGLEAKVVFLPDTCAIPDQRLDSTVFDLNKGTGLPPLIAWSPRKDDDPPRVEQARADERRATLREYRRLLYVALTRAEERLYIAGFFQSRKPPEDCWGAMIERAFAGRTETVAAFWDADEVVHRIVSPGAGAPTSLGLQPAPGQGDLWLPPGWLRRPVEAVAAPTPLRPSRLSPVVDSKAATAGRTYGTAMHLLLQHLPAVPDDRREASAQAFLQARRATIPLDMHGPLVVEALAVLAMPELAPLFASPARAEVAVVGMLMQADGNARQVRGAVDRLVVAGERVLVADFKTGVPQSPPPRAYIEQVALYRRVLAALWPDHEISMSLVWTKTPAVLALASDELDSIAATILASA